jgi:tRNA(adenine34) deaminase
MLMELSSGMARAFSEAEAAAGRGEVPVGAALELDDGTLIASAGNRTLELHDPTAHAEILVIRDAARILGSERLVGAILHVTLEPCAMCAAAISFARIKRVVFAASDPKMGAVENGIRFFNQPTCHHAPDVISGLGEQRSLSLLKEFFRVRRI